MGDPLDPQSFLGPMCSAGQRRTVLDYIKVGQQEGARLLCGGDLAAEFERGYYVSPTLFADVDNQMRIAQEEIFGPVLSLITFDTFDEALAIANDSIFGLAAGVWTSNLSKAHTFARGLRAGSVWVNQYDGGDMTAPFGGFKQSGNGRDKSLHAFDKYTELKATWIKL
jgi:4-guanidinobutyraldehyde dehydrogenase/NAD-dependent aldehyde dehydrogenase